MHNSLTVQMPDSNDQLGCEKLSLCFGEASVRFENPVEFATIDEWHDEVQAQLRLKDVINSAQEGMVGLQEDLHLENGVFKSALLQDSVLSDGLHGVLLSRSSMLAQVNATKASLADLHVQVKVVKCN